MAAVVLGAILAVLSLAVPFAECIGADENRVALATPGPPPGPAAGPAVPVPAPGLLLTDAEKAWLAAHPRIRVSLDPGWPPMEFLDRQGHTTGISVDYLTLIERRLGIRFVRVEGLSWQESYARLLHWNVDFTVSLARTPEREKSFNFTQPYISIPVVIATHPDVPYVSDMRELAGKRVAVVADYATAEWIGRDFPQIEQVRVANVKDGLERLGRGDVFAVVDNMLVIGYHAARFGLVNIKIAGNTPYTFAQTMAVRKDWPELAGILQKALDSISEAERAEIYRRWVPLRYEHGFDYALLWKLLGGFALVLAGMLYWNRRLRGEIARRKEAERGLEQHRQFLDDVFEQTPSGIFLKDLRTQRYAKVNKAVEETLGLDRGELVGKTASDLFPADVADRFTAANREVIEQGVPLCADQLVPTRQRGNRMLRIRETAVRDPQGTPQYILGIVEDITERLRLEEDFRQAQKMESVGRLAGGVAHDFNNLLMVILGNTELALQEVDPESRLYGSLLEVKDSATRSAELTRQLLAFARRQPAAPTTIDVNEAVPALLRMARRLIPESIELRWEPSPALGTIQMDRAQFDQVLLNLCVNARDAISGEGAIVVSACPRTLGEGRPTPGDGLPAGDYLELRVTDTGRGIEPAVLQHIFEPFFTTKETGRGTGLGLAMVYGIVKQSRGGIHVESEVGRGSSFVLRFPRVEQDEAAAESAEGVANLRQGRETILLVEDEAPLLRLGRTILESLGYRVYPAASPEEALRVAGTRGADLHLLISDMVMPGMNGLALSKRLRELYPALKCLFVSGYSADVVSAAGELPESIPLLQKPYSRQELGDKVREVLDGAAAAGGQSAVRPD
jgi:PAS domain S-box-containing protein